MFDETTIRVYQAFSREIALPALEKQKFVEPFKFDIRTSWIKPSFIWTMKRTGWGRFSAVSKNKGYSLNADDALVLAVDIPRPFFERILADAWVNHFEEDFEESRKSWQRKRESSNVYVQWDPEKYLSGGVRRFKAIQIGLTPAVLREYSDAIVRIVDMSGAIEKITTAGSDGEKIMLLPDERPYPVDEKLKFTLHMRN